MSNSNLNGKQAAPRLVFNGGFDERAAFEAEARGYCAGVSVEFEDGRRFPVVFYDPVRLAQDLQDETEAGYPFISEPGLIIVADVTRANMEAAVAKLTRESFFDSFVPLDATASTFGNPAHAH